MDYAEARELRKAIEQLATICWWSEPGYDAYAAIGLDSSRATCTPGRARSARSTPGSPRRRSGSEQIVDRGWFPPDPLKRAAG